MIIDLAHKWWIGVCLFLWSWITYAMLGLPVMLIPLLSYLGTPVLLADVFLGVYAVIGVPFIAYRVGREFVIHHERIQAQKSAHHDRYD